MPYDEDLPPRPAGAPRPLAAEERLRTVELLLEQVLHTVPDLLAVVRRSDGVVLHVNPGFEHTLGWSREDAVGRSTAELGLWGDEDERRRLVAHLRAGEVPEEECVLVARNGTARVALVSVRPLVLAGEPCAVILGRDVTEQRTAERQREAERAGLEAQLRQIQRLEALGRLACGVAHDFNNMLSVILEAAESARGEAPAGSRLREDLEAIHEAASLSRDLTRQLLSFSRKGTLSPRPIALGDHVRASVRHLARLVGEEVELVAESGGAQCTVFMDPSQLDQVLLNLALNARDAMPHGGHLHLDLARRRVGEAEAGGVPEARPGDYVVLTVRDDGVGMDTETQRHLFEPFFTTKRAGKGTGLGLSTVQAIVRQNGGFVRVDSAPGRGTTFRVHLPHAPDEAQAAEGDAF